MEPKHYLRYLGEDGNLVSKSINSLPDLPSELLKVALADLRKATQTEGVKINMDAWLNTNLNPGFCSVCFAGSLLIGSLGFIEKPDSFIHNGDFHLIQLDPVTGEKLLAIEDFRQGKWEEALNHMNLVLPKNFPRVYVPADSQVSLSHLSYQDVESLEFKTFIEHMEFTVGMLEAEGL